MCKKKDTVTVTANIRVVYHYQEKPKQDFKNMQTK